MLSEAWAWLRLLKSVLFWYIFQNSIKRKPTLVKVWLMADINIYATFVVLEHNAMFEHGRRKADLQG